MTILDMNEFPKIWLLVIKNDFVEAERSIYYTSDFIVIPINFKDERRKILII